MSKVYNVVIESEPVPGFRSKPKRGKRSVETVNEILALHRRRSRILWLRKMADPDFVPFYKWDRVRYERGKEHVKEILEGLICHAKTKS